MFKNHPITIAKLALIGLAAAFVVWRVVAINISELLVQGDEPNAATQALLWDASRADALYLEALRSAKENSGQSSTLLKSAVRSNPADGPSYAAIARIHEAGGDLKTAENAIETAVRMAPQRVDVQYEAAGFWMRRGDIPRAMKHLNVVLTYGGSLRRELFPDLLKLAEDPATREATFSGILLQPLVWWADFFTYAAGNATHIDTRRALSAMQASGPNPMPPASLRAYLERLQKEGLWIDAYITWLNSLRKDQLNAIGNLFNGDFETEISNKGFDWIITPSSQAVVETASTHGANGSKALRVLFRGPRIQFQNLRQHLMLDPGNYLLRGRVRPDHLEATKGVRWSIYCHSQPTPLASSETFRGSDHWTHFSVLVEIPRQDCAVQTIRLELAGRSALDFEAKGAIWFDDLSLTRQRLD